MQGFIGESSLQEHSMNIEIETGARETPRRLILILKATLHTEGNSY